MDKVKFKRYILFGFYTYESAGGFGDYLIDFDEISEIISLHEINKFIKKTAPFDITFQLLDRLERKVYVFNIEDMESVVERKQELCIISRNIKNCDEIKIISEDICVKRYLIYTGMNWEQQGGVYDIQLGTDNLDDILDRNLFKCIYAENCYSDYIEIYDTWKQKIYTIELPKDLIMECEKFIKLNIDKIKNLP